MARKRLVAAARRPGHDWYLADWMRTLRITQADLTRLTGWSAATVNDIYHGRTEYYRGIVNTVAQVLNIRVYEIFMHPDEAMALRQVQQQALRVADASVRFSEQAPQNQSRQFQVG